MVPETTWDNKHNCIWYIYLIATIYTMNNKYKIGIWCVNMICKHKIPLKLNMIILSFGLPFGKNEDLVCKV